MSQQVSLLERDGLHPDMIKRSFSATQQVLRLSLSILCVILFLVSMRIYQDKDNLTPTQVNTFNAVSGSLSILLGLSFFVSLIKALMAKTVQRCFGRATD